MPTGQQESKSSPSSNISLDSFIDSIEYATGLMSSPLDDVAIPFLHNLIKNIQTRALEQQNDHDDAVHHICISILRNLDKIPLEKKSELINAAIQLLEQNLSARTLDEAKIQFTALRRSLYLLIKGEQSNIYNAAKLLADAQVQFGEKNYKRASELYLASLKQHPCDFGKSMFHEVLLLLHSSSSPLPQKPSSFLLLKEETPQGWINIASKAFQSARYGEALIAYAQLVKNQADFFKKNPSSPVRANFPIPDIIEQIQSANIKNDSYYRVSTSLLTLVTVYIEDYLLELDLTTNEGRRLCEITKWLLDAYINFATLYSEGNQSAPEFSIDDNIARTRAILAGLIAHQEQNYVQASANFETAQKYRPSKICENLIVRTRGAIVKTVESANNCKELLAEIKQEEDAKVAKARKYKDEREQEEKRRGEQSETQKQINKIKADLQSVKREEENAERKKKRDYDIQRRQKTNPQLGEEKNTRNYAENLIMELPSNIKALLYILEGAGKYIAYLGGSSVTYNVAAQLQKKSSNMAGCDFDLYTTMPPNEIEKCFEGSIKKYKRLEVAKGIHAYRFVNLCPIVEIVYCSNLADLKVRALELDCHHKALFAGLDGVVRDPLGGLKYLVAGTYKTIEKPVESFRRDPSRILRAITDIFKMEWSFPSEIKQAISQTACELNLYLKEIHIDLLDTRMKKLFDDGLALKGKFSLLRELNLIAVLFPGLEKNTDRYAVWIEEILSAADDYKKVDPLTLFYLALLTASEKGRSEVALIFKHLYVNNRGREESVRAIPETVDSLLKSLDNFKVKRQQFPACYSPTLSFFPSMQVVCTHSPPYLHPHL